MPSLPVLTLFGRLVVETGSPDALCPDLASAEEAIVARLGELEAGDAANWRVRYTSGHAPDAASGDFVRIEVFDPRNELKLSRDLPLAGESCATMARVIALVVDRFFRTTVAEHNAEIQTSQNTSNVPQPADKAAQKAPRPVAATSTLTAQAGVVAPPFSPTLGLGFSQRTPYPVSLALGLTWIVLPLTEELEAGGRAESRSAFLRLFPTWDIGFGRAVFALGPTLALGGERGATTGLPESDVRYRAFAAAGAMASFRLGVGERLGLDLSGGAEAPFLPFGGTFAVDGTEVLKSPGFRAFVAIGVGPAW